MLEVNICLALTDQITALSASDTIEELLGFPNDDFISGRIALNDLIHPHDRDIADAIFTRTTHPASGTFNIRIRQANGRIRCVQGSFEKRPDTAGADVVLDLLLCDAKSLKRTLDEAVSTSNFRAMMDNTDDYIYFKDRNHVFTGASQTLVSLCDPAEHWTDLIGQTDYDVFPEEYADIYYHLEKQVFAGITVAHEIQETLTKDGKKGWVDNRKYPIRNDSGEIIGLYGIARDITELKQSAKELLQNKKRLEEAQRITNIGCWELDLLNDELTWSDQIYRTFEVGQNHFGPSYTAFLASIHPEDRDAVNEAYTKSLATREPYRISHRLLMPDGRIKHVLEQCETSFTPEGKPLRSIGTVQDITEQKRADQVLQQTLQLTTLLAELSTQFLNVTAPELDQALADAQRRICNLMKLDISAIFQQLQEDPPGLKMTHVYRDPDGPPLPATLSGRDSFPWCEQQLRSGNVVKVNSMKELPIEADRDKESWDHYGIRSTLIFPLIDRGSRILGTLSFGRMREECFWTEELVKQLHLAAQLFANVLSRNHAEEDKIRLESQLHQVQKMESIGTLAGGVAHDFNNKLTIILGYTCLAETEFDAIKLHEYNAVIRNAAEQSADLTRQLLAFARKQTIIPKVLDLNETISGMLKMLQRLIGEGINLNWHPAPHLWEVKLDPSQIDQILANLCVNARDSIADVGTITIETGISIIDQEYCTQHTGFEVGEYVRLSVSDDGCGMDKETQVQIFEPFFTTKGVGEGTGLGLATVYGIVRQNKGFINVYSKLGLGSTFTIYLPRYMGTPEKAQTKDAVEPARRGQGTILLVEDDPAILKITRLILVNLGYNVLAANSPAEAISIASDYTSQINLLMTDVVMPGMNGRDLAKKLKSQHRHIKCLFMSGYTANVIAHHGVLDSGLHFIQKPFNMNMLADKLREVLDT